MPDVYRGQPRLGANGAPYPLQSFYPALWFNRESPEALYARNLVQHFYRHGEIGKTDVFRAHFFTWLVPPAIRCDYPAEEVLKVIRSVVEKTMLPNFTYWDQALLTEHQVIDGIGAMFLQSVNGRLIVFPNWTMGTDAAFHQLREDGAFLVSSAVKRGVIDSVTIASEKGLPCRVRNPWPGRGVQVDADGIAVAATRNAADTYSFATKLGGMYTLRPHGEAPIYHRPEPPLRPDEPPAKIVDQDFADDFSAGRDHWLIDHNNCWKVEDRGLCLNNRKYGVAFAPLKNRVWHDATYEFDQSSGNDAADGKSEATAWKTLVRASQSTYGFGDKILLKCGDTWGNDTLRPQGSPRPAISSAASRTSV